MSNDTVVLDKRSYTHLEVARELKSARRMYAAGHHKEAAKMARSAFRMAQQIRARDAAAYVERMKTTVDTMEQINELTKALVEKHREGDSWH